MDAAFRRAFTPRRVTFLRFTRAIIRNGRHLRPFSSLAIHHRHLNLEHSLRLQAVQASREGKIDYAIQCIRTLFGTNPRYNRGLVSDIVPENLDSYEIGKNIGYGSNAAVYALRLREQHSGSQSKSENSAKKFPLALKLMYNFELDRKTPNDDHLWRFMGTELVALPRSKQILNGRMGKFSPLPSTHPNVVRMLTAFVDQMPILPDARSMYPEALPTAQFYDVTIHEPRTLFVIMKRYKMTLRDYAIKERRNYWTGRVLLGQLLEGLVFLNDNKIAQRDMKSDNILLEFDNSDDVPHLVISDFGCALATGSWIVKYNDDTVGLGGNIATRAPEIALASPSPDSIVDFSMADVWAAGGLGYEIFTRRNPFYSNLKSATYKESDLPLLSSRIPQAVRSVVRDILKRDPSQRQTPHVAANVVCLSLFRFGNDVRQFLADCGVTELNPSRLKNSFSEVLKELGARADKSLNDVLTFLSAESIIARNISPPVISDSELQLRATFLSRLDRNQLWEAVGYFFEPAQEDKLSLNSISDFQEITKNRDTLHRSSISIYN
ncbi:unnamed protein product [Auanema sp. JU1783]|nr:unnamed protein product [Auanema sp. JU1783]